MDSRITEKITKEKSGCWLWTGGATTSRSGERYPSVRIGSKTFMVRRVLYEDRHGAGSLTKRSTMSCGNSLCVNPEHVLPFSAATNAERMRKSRRKQLSGIGGVRKLAKAVGFRLERVGRGRYVVERVA